MHDRRAFLSFVASVLGAGCSSAELELEQGDQMSFGLAPWHMWGNSQTFNITTAAAGSGTPAAGPQLVKIAYKRPESWRFFFFARFSNIVAAVPYGDKLSAAFDLIIGVGRSSVSIPNFVQMSMNTSATPFPGGNLIWTSQALQPPQFPTDTSVNMLDQIIAEDIQCQCRAQVGNANGTPVSASIECGAFFAPNVHIRPEWFSERYPAREDQGT